ncbi:hypothetical protein IU433_28650 [Nocardia puris]|uniref:hypothetical protein n=1 Tax=Nocardia puris TaxID=208602 RepID=UPI001893CB24|nr:hypothetical protein [Nocardia puris]MBF6368491.1 hypothetical protein [Nocardia puris]MBF6462978.1 hypothetical protein [Nocardia puris]
MADSTTRATPGTVGWGIVTALGVVTGYVAVLLANARHFYADDTESQYAPLWVMMGERLRAGEFPVLVPEHWLAGNYAIEEAGLLNPPQLLIDLIAPSVDNLALYATVVKLLFAIILGLGVFRICLAYGSRAPWAAVAGVALPFSGWLLFFDEASWMTAFTGTAWLTHAWASGVRYARGRGGPIPVFVFLYLTISVQYVFPAVEAGLMIAAVVIGEVVYQRVWRPSLRLLAVSACAALAGLATYLPSALSAKSTWRGTAQINNEPLLTVPWSESLNASLPSTLPAFTSWWGYVQPMPVVYIAWFLIPALAFIDWERAKGMVRELTGPIVFAAVALMWAAGPGAIGPLRWPGRVLPMVALGLLVLVCVLLGRCATVENARTRGLVAAALIGVLWVRSISAAPSEFAWHVVAALAVGALGVVTVWLTRNRGGTAACGFVVATVAPIAYLQVAAAQPTPLGWNLPEKRSEMKAAFPDFPGTTLQLADRALIPPGERAAEGAYGSLVFGNYAKNLGLDYVGGYTPNGHFYFGELLCMRWDVSACPDAYRRAFAVEPSTGKTIVDLMKIDRVVLHTALYPDARGQEPPAGWRWVDYPGHERYIAVLERLDGPVSTVNGRIAVAEGVRATSLAESDTTSRVRVSSDSGGRVVFARLGWPGYRVTLDGREIPFDTVARTFVAVDIPADTEAELVLSWRPPGWKIGGAAALLGVAGVAALHWLYRRERDPDAPAPAPPTPAELVGAR